ncbi:MAG: hypothetical protein M3Y78_11510, partial [Pseudomonadota bacterium]|nr:hypothetical protein [Pseudomonadota bacterium]
CMPHPPIRTTQSADFPGSGQSPVKGLLITTFLASLLTEFAGGLRNELFDKPIIRCRASASGINSTSSCFMGEFGPPRLQGRHQAGAVALPPGIGDDSRKQAA